MNLLLCYMRVFLKRGDEAFEISEGKIYRLTARRIDEGDGRFYDVSDYRLFPGFVDTHTHLIGRFLLDLDVSGRKDKGEIIKAIERLAEEREEIIVYGRDETVIGEAIEPEDIDHIDKPVLAIRVDGHVGVTNKALREKYNVESKVYEDELYDLLQMMKRNKRREPAVEKALELMQRRGVIRVGEISKDLLTIRVASEMGFPAEFLLEALDEAEEAKGLIKRIKVYADGSLGAHTAALREPYRDDPNNTGKLLLTSDQIHELAIKAEKLGVGLAVHAIGDRAIDEVLDGLKNTDADKHRIEHFELVREEQIEEASKLGVWISVQPNFVYNRGGINGLYHKRLGPERLMRIMPLDEFLAFDLKFAFGSDCMPFDPIIGLKGAVEHPFHPIGLKEAVYLYTIRAAELLKFPYPRPTLVVIDKSSHESVLEVGKDYLRGSLPPSNKVIVGAKRELKPEEFIEIISGRIRF